MKNFNPTAILLSEQQKVELPYGVYTNQRQSTDTLKYILTFNQNLVSYGYYLSKEVIELLSFLELSEFLLWTKSITNLILNEMELKPYVKPLFPSFPHEILKEDDFDLLCDVILHFDSKGNYCPVSITNAVFPSTIPSYLPVKVVNVGTRKDYIALFDDILRDYL